MIEKIFEYYSDETFYRLEGFDDAIIGFDEVGARLIYSVSKCIKILMKDMTEDDAFEYFDYNVVNLNLGNNTPILCFDYFE